LSEWDVHTRLFLDHRAALVDYATPIVGSRANAEDVVQEAYLRFSAAGDGNARVAAIEQPSAYLYRIVRNHALDVARRLATERRREGGAIDPLPAIPDPTASPERIALKRDELRRVMATIDALPERSRRALELYRFQDWTLQQIAAELGISTTMAHKLVRSALTACMDRLGDTDED
jgi:RNA polymerase sigma factor (sigma-70 family)